MCNKNEYLHPDTHQWIGCETMGDKNWINCQFTDFLHQHKYQNVSRIGHIESCLSIIASVVSYLYFNISVYKV